MSSPSSRNTSTKVSLLYENFRVEEFEKFEGNFTETSTKYKNYNAVFIMHAKRQRDNEREREGEREREI